MSDLLIPSFLVSDVNESLRSLTKSERCEQMAQVAHQKNEWPWAICSGRSEEMSNHEQIAQVAHQKWVNELIARFFEQIAHSLIRSFLDKKQMIRSENRWANSELWSLPAPALYHFQH